MQIHDVRVHPEADRLKREEQLAWKIAEVAADPVAVEAEVSEMIVNRIIDNASVAIAAINRHPVTTARTEALARRQVGSGAAEETRYRVGDLELDRLSHRVTPDTPAGNRMAASRPCAT